MVALPEVASHTLLARMYCSNSYYNSSDCYSSWYWWGRWVFTGVVIVVIIGILMLLGCINARRRRRRGAVPMYGTGWMSKNAGPQNNAAAYAPQGGYQYGPPPPQYSPNAPNTVPSQQTGNTYNSNDGYYGHHNEGIQLQQPANAYTPGGAGGYEPPPGPPPNKVA